MELWNWIWRMGFSFILPVKLSCGTMRERLLYLESHTSIKKRVDLNVSRLWYASYVCHTALLAAIYVLMLTAYLLQRCESYGGSTFFVQLQFNPLNRQRPCAIKVDLSILVKYNICTHSNSQGWRGTRCANHPHLFARSIIHAPFVKLHHAKQLQCTTKVSTSTQGLMRSIFKYSHKWNLDFDNFDNTRTAPCGEQRLFAPLVALHRIIHNHHDMGSYTSHAFPSFKVKLNDSWPPLLSYNMQSVS
jgi:hypothetical protein